MCPAISSVNELFSFLCSSYYHIRIPMHCSLRYSSIFKISNGMFCLGSIDVCFKVSGVDPSGDRATSLSDHKTNTAQRHSSWNLIAVGPPLHHFPVSAYVLLFSSGCSEPEPPNKSFTERYVVRLVCGARVGTNLNLIVLCVGLKLQLLRVVFALLPLARPLLDLCPRLLT